ncbi:PREDICTED: serine/threonine-protein phosphatase 6 regulatory ankyrin repeat subunit A-like [Acropora digitifera]|uniref:serine/threonine-protein phosphatase 6 regulatory ankyrin repeat subunit A-like n=1 Tax=Acropora digitifera TaxID=70779 RepID=UPI00077AC03A|nr:PREDICTED: serine/threonine-protein phosphatase 6 regulatory ankyrin repeat subunit A-like [Acropora digitifera]
MIIPKIHRKELEAKFITKNYGLLIKDIAVGSLIIVLNCQRKESLEHLWHDYLSGHLDKVAVRYLVTDEMKKRLNLETINLKTTIEKENYLKCRKVLMDCSGEADRTLFSQQDDLDQEISMIGKATVGSEEEVIKQEDTDWMFRMKKAKASRSALHKASVNGQYEEVKRHLSSGCAVDVKDQFLLTPLHLACWYGQESVVKLLLEHGADVNATDKFQFTPLHKAERRNHESIVKLLVDHKARPTLQQPLSLRTLGRKAFTRRDEHSGFNLLQAAVLEGDYDTITKASVHLENFVEEMNCRTTGEKASIFPGKSAADILLSVKRRRGILFISNIYEEFVETEETLTKLHSCAKSNDVEMAIELVLNDGIDVNVARLRNITDNQGNTPLHTSTRKGLCDISQLLVDSGCKINARNDRGQTPLHSAVRGNNVADVEILLKNNAEVNIHNVSGNTPLHISTHEGLCQISQLLVDSGCRINATNSVGETPLHSAVRGNNVADIKLLLGNNADANVQDNQGNTPLHISRRDGFFNISQLLIDSRYNKKRISFFESEDQDDPWMNQPTMSTLSSPIVSKLKEQNPIEGSGILLDERQELLSREELEPAVPRKLKRTKDRTSRVERSGTNCIRCEVM